METPRLGKVERANQSHMAPKGGELGPKSGVSLRIPEHFDDNTHGGRGLGNKEQGLGFSPALLCLVDL